MKLLPEESKEELLQILLGSETFNSWIKSANISTETRAELAIANVLFVPEEIQLTDDQDEIIVCFPDGTADLYHFLIENKTEELSIGVCIEDDDYKELARRSDLLIVAGIVAANLVAPIIVNLISEYIIRKFDNRADKATVKAKLTVVVEEEKRSIEYLYDGPALEYRDVMLDALAKLPTLPEERPIKLPAKSVGVELIETKKSKKKHKKKKK